MSDLPASISTIPQHNPVALIKTLETILSGEQKAPEDFNWLGLAEVATTLATSTERSLVATTSLQWAQVALLAYDFLMQRYNASAGDSYRNASLMLRANMIGTFGSVPQDPVLDLQNFLLSFFESLPFSYDEVKDKAVDWSSLSSREQLMLRNIRRNISILKHLCDERVMQPDQAIQMWLSLYDKLP